jgi:uncharacterized delta-60 repeat protein
MRASRAAVLLVGVGLAAAVGWAPADGVGKSPTLDPSFGGKGVVRIKTTAEAVDERPEDLVEDAQGRLLVLYRRWDPVAYEDRHFLARFTRAGALDATYGAAGLFELSSLGRFFGLARDAQGRVLVAGQTIEASSYEADLRVLRLTPEGALDETFGVGGVATVVVPDEAFTIVQVVVDASDRPVVAVNTSRSGPTSNTYLSRVVRLTTSGAPDPTFAAGGIYSDMDLLPAAIHALAADGDRCVVVGVEELFTAGYTAKRFVRLDASGAPDPTFGTGGLVRFLDPKIWYGEPTGLGVDAEHRVIVGGDHDVSLEDDTDAIVLRFTPAGALDPTFGGGAGFVVLDPSKGGYEWKTHFRMDPRGHGHYVVFGDLTSRQGHGGGWWLAEVPQDGGAPRIFRQRVSDLVGIVRTYAMAFSRDGAPIVGMNFEDEDWTGEDPGDDLYLARVRPTPSGPADLAVAWKKAPTAKCPAAGGACSVKGTVTIANSGARPAAKTTVRFYASDDATLDAGDDLVAEAALPAVAGGGSRVVALKGKTAVPLAGRRVLAVVDEAGLVAERHEANQLAASAVIP